MTNALEYYLLKGRLQAWDGRVQAGTGLEARRLYMPSGWAFPRKTGALGPGSAFLPEVYSLAVAGGQGSAGAPYPAAATLARPATGVYLGGVLLGNFDLSDARIPLPPAAWLVATPCWNWRTSSRCAL